MNSGNSPSTYCRIRASENYSLLAQSQLWSRTIYANNWEVRQNCTHRWKELETRNAQIPQSTTDISPSEALNQRKLKVTLPELALVKHGQQQIKPQSAQSKIAKTDADKKLKMKIYADAKAHAKETSIKPGEVVLMRQTKLNKLSTPYNPKPFVVEAKKGTMVTVSNGPKTITRN